MVTRPQVNVWKYLCSSHLIKDLQTLTTVNPPLPLQTVFYLCKPWSQQTLLCVTSSTSTTCCNLLCMTFGKPPLCDLWMDVVVYCVSSAAEMIGWVLYFAEKYGVVTAFYGDILFLFILCFGFFVHCIIFIFISFLFILYFVFIFLFCFIILYFILYNFVLFFCFFVFLYFIYFIFYFLYIFVLFYYFIFYYLYIFVFYFIYIFY